MKPNKTSLTKAQLAANEDMQGAPETYHSKNYIPADTSMPTDFWNYNFNPITGHGRPKVTRSKRNGNSTRTYSLPKAAPASHPRPGKNYSTY